MAVPRSRLDARADTPSFGQRWRDLPRPIRGFIVLSVVSILYVIASVHLAFLAFPGGREWAGAMLFVAWLILVPSVLLYAFLSRIAFGQALRILGHQSVSTPRLLLAAIPLAGTVVFSVLWALIESQDHGEVLRGRDVFLASWYAVPCLPPLLGLVLAPAMRGPASRTAA